MKQIQRVAKPLSIFLAVYFFLLCGPHQAALAALVGTENVLDAARVANAREVVSALMAREEIQAALVARGIDPVEAGRRAATLSGAEAVRLADAVDTLPAGGSALAVILGASLVVFIVLLISDILGYTDVFPFTRRHR
jgi:hypothetical protein